MVLLPLPLLIEPGYLISRFGMTSPLDLIDFTAQYCLVWTKPRHEVQSSFCKSSICAGSHSGSTSLRGGGSQATRGESVCSLSRRKPPGHSGAGTSALGKKVPPPQGHFIAPRRSSIVPGIHTLSYGCWKRPQDAYLSGSLLKTNQPRGGESSGCAEWALHWQQWAQCLLVSPVASCSLGTRSPKAKRPPSGKLSHQHLTQRPPPLFPAQNESGPAWSHRRQPSTLGRTGTQQPAADFSSLRGSAPLPFLEHPGLRRGPENSKAHRPPFSLGP